MPEFGQGNLCDSPKMNKIHLARQVCTSLVCDILGGEQGPSIPEDRTLA